LAAAIKRQRWMAPIGFIQRNFFYQPKLFLFREMAAPCPTTLFALRNSHLKFAHSCNVFFGKKFGDIPVNEKMK
jgi:hypothetical protein